MVHVAVDKPADRNFARVHSQMAIAPTIASHSIARHQRRRPHVRVEFPNNRDPYLEAVGPCLTLNALLHLGKSIPAPFVFVTGTDKVQERRPLTDSTHVGTFLPQTVVIDSSHGHRFSPISREIRRQFADCDWLQLDDFGLKPPSL